jgi:5-methylcytosine-specific restriction enzyme subunit McrC
LQREARRLIVAFEDKVMPIRLDATVLDRVSHKLNRLTVAYEPAIVLIRVLCESQGVSFEGTESSQRIPGFLFDMNRFFQALLFRFLAENLPTHTIRDEYRLRGMMQYVPGFNPHNRRSPAPRPDFIVLTGQQVVAILDAKYRDLWKQSLPRDMLYQLAMYAMVHSQSVATILYPTTDAAATEARIGIRDPVYGKEIAQVRLRPVILSVVEGLVISPLSAIAKRQRTAYARYLAFGEYVYV